AEYDSVTTDPSGKWTSSRVPSGFESLSFKVTHPEYILAEYEQAAAAAGPKEVAKSDLLANKAVLVLEPGIPVEGIVTRDGQPAAGAEITLIDVSDTPQKRTARSDEK